MFIILLRGAIIVSDNLSVPYSWDSLDKSILQRSAELIRNTSQETIDMAIIEHCQEHFGYSNLSKQSMSIATQPLLDVDGAAIVARLKKPSEKMSDGYLNFAGLARLVRVENGLLPIVFIFPGAKETTLAHECIHLCQLLNSQTYQLTLDERIDVFEQNVEFAIEKALNISPEQALDFLIRSTCYKVWIELEAIYYSNIDENPHTVLTLVDRSSQPFDTLGFFVPEFGIYDSIPNARNICIEKFENFCNELESQVDWIKGLIDRSENKTLYDALLWCSDERETDMWLGPFDESDYYTDEITRMMNEEWIRNALGDDYVEDEDEEED